MGKGGGHVDDTSICNSAELWRRIHPRQIVPDQNRHRMRPSSAAFSDSSDGTPMSVLRASLVARSRRDEFSILRQYPGEALAAFTAGIARRLHQGVEPDPLPDESAHAYIFGPKPKHIKRALATKSIWVVEPDRNKAIRISESDRSSRIRFLIKRCFRGAQRMRANLFERGVGA